MPAAERYEHVAGLLRQSTPLGAALLHDEFLPDVKRIVRRLLGPDSDHDDVVQQVFLHVLTSGKQIRDPQRLNAWLRALTAHTVCREIRRRSARRSLHSELPVPEHSDPSRDVDCTDRLLSAKRVLERMPPRHRAVFILHRLERYTTAEVAATFGWSLATAKRRIAAARARFQRLGGDQTETEPA